MCGICGIHEYARQGTPRLEPIAAMTDALAHRGPDGAGTWCTPRLALGHRRLSIFDLSSAGLQPMHSADGLATVVFNGEIYNYRELRADHERRGHRFRSGTDTEVLLEHYRLHGPRALDDFRGMFAFALWDAARDVLVVARDRLGVKPLYWWDRDGTFLFASELKSLLRHPDVRAELDRARLAEWYALRFTPAPATLFRGIRKLEPGHYLEVGAHGVRQVAYWDLPDPEPLTDRREAAERWVALFEESVRLRMRADVPVGVFLSGGLDSSTVAAFAAREAGAPLETFTVGYGAQSAPSELPRARAVARHLGTTHHELLLDDVPPEALDEVVRHLEEPIGDPATVLLHRLARFTRERVTVVLSGEGSDETNLGYGKFRAYRRWAALRRLGPGVERWWLERAVPGAWGAPGRPLLARVYAELTWPGAGARAAAMGDGGAAWLAGLDGALGAGRRAPFDDLLRLDFKTWLGEDLLLKVDKTTMAFALEARVPFLDHKLVEFALAIPPSWKIGRAGTKLFLRDRVRGMLPAGAVDGAQHGFLAPLAQWFGGAWRGPLERALGPEGLGARGLVAPAHLAALRAGLAAGREEALLPSFMLASLESWCRTFGVETEAGAP
jgi:asparagine synthase (glutamine-hydrolysing)